MGDSSRASIVPWRLRAMTAFVRMGLTVSRLAPFHSPGRGNACQPKSLYHGEGDAGPDSSIGLILNEPDAPKFFKVLQDLSRLVMAPCPQEIRLSYLPGCAALTTDDKSARRTLIVGLPSFLTWSVEEMKAVLAHELAHFRDDDSAWMRKSTTSIADLRRLSQSSRLVGYFTSPFRHAARQIAWHLEFRADNAAVDCVGADALASALQKLAVSQAVFQQVLAVYPEWAIALETVDNVYARFGQFWRSLPADNIRLLRRMALVKSVTTDCHPPLADRLERIGSKSYRRTNTTSCSMLENVADLEWVMHNRIFGVHAKPQNVFERTRI
jgi:Zn-dependent protease with chaperone function